MSAARRTQSHARALLSLAALAAVVAYLVQLWSEVLVPAALSRATVLESNLTSLLQPQRLTTTAQQCAPAALDSVNEVRGSSVEEVSSETRLTALCAQELLHPLLSELVKTPFFRYFRVNLYGHCHFWPEDGMCALPDCSVCECPADEVPVPWRAPELGVDVEAPQGGPLTPQTAECVGDQSAAGIQEAQLNAVEGLVNKDNGMETRTMVAAWGQRDNPWTADNEAVQDADAGATYVNLRLNPERYTGYAGEHAHRVWTAIYAQPCFAGQGGGLCAAGQAAPHEETRVFYRLISGLHASISTHIAADYLLQRGSGIGAGDVWGPDYGVFWDRVGSHPDRLENLYFVTSFVLRAVTKARPFLLAADYSTGFADEDRATAERLRTLLTSSALLDSCAVPFDETSMFTGLDGHKVKDEMRGYFRNISAVMGCVGCEKCRLWGKLQTLGLATALEVLFPDEPLTMPALQRNEVIALVNFLGRLSDSLQFSRSALDAIQSGRVSLTKPARTHELSWL